MLSIRTKLISLLTAVALLPLLGALCLGSYSSSSFSL